MPDKKLNMDQAMKQIERELKTILENKTHAAAQKVVDFAAQATQLMGEAITQGRIDLVPQIQKQIKVLADANQVRFAHETNVEIMGFIGSTIRILGTAIVA